MPTILQVLPRLESGGVERGTVDLSGWLVRRGWTSLVASEGGALVTAIERGGGTHLTLPLATKSPLGIWLNAGRLARLARKHAVDLIHARSRAPAWSAKRAAERSGARFVTTYHAVYSGSDRSLKRRYNEILASGERVIAISDYVARHLREVYGLGPDRLRTVHRGVDLREFDPARIHGLRVAELALRWGLEPAHRVVLVPGRLAPTKGHRWFLEAFARVARKDAIAVVVGGADHDSGYARELEELVARLQIVDRVRFVGACAHMPAAYALADLVAVTPARPEAFGRVSIEAQAMARPVIAADEGGLPETLRHGVTGWLVPPGDVPALAASLDEALDLPAAERAEMGRRGRAFVSERYALEQMVNATLAVYAELLGHHAASQAA